VGLANKNIFNRKFALYAALALFVCLIPWGIQNAYIMKVMCNVLIYSIIALSVNLIVGISGQLDFGRSAFAGLGGYFSAIMFTTVGVPFLLAMIGGALFAAFFGLVLGLLCSHSSFDYLTLVTIGFSEIVRLVIQNWKSLTGGAFGFRTGRPVFFGFELKSHIAMYYFCLLMLILSYIAINRIIKSKMGRAFQAIRDDQIAAAYTGIDVPFYKAICFTVGSFFTGLAGALMVHYTRFASPSNYTIDESLIMLQMAILGGLGSLPGSIIGAIILVVFPEISRSFYQFRLLFIGIIMVVLMLFAPNGLLGRNGVVDMVSILWHKFRNRNQKFHKGAVN
jgi:branched-chain amino acid transport system permease protein